MSIQEEQIVMPGDKIGIIEQYMPGEGAYDDDGDIKSAVLGNVKIDQRKKIISVVGDSKPALLKKGDMIYGQITDLKPQKAIVSIECIKNNERELALPYTGVIHISNAKNNYLKEIGDAFRIGDIIQARVIKLSGDNIDLSTTSRECGVVKAICTRCRDYMHTIRKKNEVKCFTCNKKEKRKISKNYVNELK